jgi:hypothetical protein
MGLDVTFYHMLIEVAATLLNSANRDAPQVMVSPGQHMLVELLELLFRPL